MRDALAVHGRALTLAIRLLCSSAAAVALISLDACCPLDFTPWGPSESLELGTDADLHAVAPLAEYVDDRNYAYIAVGAGGTVVVWGDDFVELSSVGELDLRAIWATEGSWWVVGDGGIAAVSGDRGLTWTIVELGTTANLRGITSVGSRLVVVGDDVVRVQSADGIWSEVIAPAGDWGQLRAVYYDGSRVYAVGLGGVIWSAEDPSGEWVAEASGVDTDLFAIDTISYEELAVVGAGGTMLVRDAGGWTRATTKVSVDLLDCNGGAVLGAGGEVFEVGNNHELVRMKTFAGARAFSFQSHSDVVVVGEDGKALATYYYPSCDTGRPFIVDGQRHTASLCGNASWCERRNPTPCPELGAAAELLAAGWAQDGLQEHASVASFARFGLELLALGAPPRLLREVQRAIQDELRHARLCFGLARRFAGVALGPGAMRVPVGALGRVGDPVATALAVFEEGCVNESLAACEAAEAAAACDDAEVREVLERIAADERDHAIMAWNALRWLLDTYGERVRGPLRARLPQFGPGLARYEAEFDPRLTAYGRLSPRRRAQVHRRVFAELIHPLAHAMLEPESKSSGHAEALLT
jgi:hypothetical protein